MRGCIDADQSTATRRWVRPWLSRLRPGSGNSYMILIASRLAQMNGWTEEQVTALTTGISTNDAKIDGLAGLVRKAAANSGNVTDATWTAAQQAGWSNEQLADAFA